MDPATPIASFRVRPRFTHGIVGRMPTETRNHLLQNLPTDAALEVKAFAGIVGLHLPETEQRY